MMHSEKGFTIVEMLIAFTVGIIVVGAIATMVTMGQRSSGAIEMKVTSGQDARGALEIMASEIRMASYNPNYVSGIWKGTDCGTGATQTNKGIQQATDSALTIEMDINDSGAIGDNPNEIITYAYDSANQRITRQANTTAGGSSCGSAESFLGDTAASKLPRTVRVINGSSGLSVFQYYDGKGALMSAPINIPNIRRVEITLQVQTDQNSPMSNQPIASIYKTSVIPRNHAIIP